MCGIFGYVGKRLDAATLVFEGLKKLEYRGYDSWGIAVVPTANAKFPPKAHQPLAGKIKNEKWEGKIIVKKKAGKIGDASVAEMPPSSFSFGHTRWATHGGVTDINAHPHLDCSATLAVIHNGIMENYEGIKQTLVKQGHHFVSETDTEVVAHLIEEYRKTMMFTKAVQRAFNDMEGLNAIIVLDAKDRQLVAARNGSPLVVGFGDNENFLASDASALLPHTKQVHFLEDNEMAIVTEEKIHIFNTKTGDRIRPKKQHLNWTVSQVEKGKYPFFMLKEIHEQPGVIADIAASDVVQAKEMADKMKTSQHLYMLGCGTASYAAIAGEYLFSKIAKRHANVAIGSEFGYHLDFLNSRSMVVAISQSGETMDILESVKKAKMKGAKILALVNVLGSTLYREAHEKMLIGAGPEKGVASTKAFIGMLAHLTMLAYALAGKVDEGVKVLTLAAKSAKSVMGETHVRRIKTLAKKLKDKNHIYVIGRGLSYPTALETALKIKEISYIHAEGLAAGELKHGPLALVTKGTPCIAFLPNDETYGANLAGAMEMKARGGYIIGVSYKPHEIFDYYLAVADAREATIIPNVIVAQLLAYYVTIERGFDPDMPRNLAKSVTVK